MWAPMALLLWQKRDKLEAEQVYDSTNQEELRIVEGQRTDPDTALIEGQSRVIIYVWLTIINWHLIKAVRKK